MVLLFLMLNVLMGSSRFVRDLYHCVLISVYLYENAATSHFTTILSSFLLSKGAIVHCYLNNRYRQLKRLISFVPIIALSVLGA